MIIALTGQKRSGKDSLAGHLVGDLGFTRLAFADAIRETLADIDPLVLTPEQDRPTRPVRLSKLVADLGWEEAKNQPEVRRLLQETGGAMRRVDPDVWTRVLLQRLETLQAKDPDVDVVVTDVRLPAEAAVLAEADPTARLVRVRRPSLGRDTSREALHFTETVMTDHPVFTEVVNDGSLRDLRTRAHRLVAAVSEDVHTSMGRASA